MGNLFRCATMFEVLRSEHSSGHKLCDFLNASFSVFGELIDRDDFHADFPPVLLTLVPKLLEREKERERARPPQYY